MPRREIQLQRETVADIEAAGVRRGRPLLVVDTDEVIVHFAGHLASWLNGVGYEMRLTQYQLEGAIYPTGEATPVSFEAALTLIDAFFAEETEHQRPIDGAIEAIARLSREAQVVVLTNVPRQALAARRANLRGLGVEAPVVANLGGKGRALRLLADAAAAPAVFVDDSPGQIASAAKHARGVTRLHFQGSPYLRRVMPEAPDAHASPGDWAACEAMVRRGLEL
ncbi:MAG: hypothetical protein AAF677_09545 [Pseudomonadota bacterium]